MNFIKRIVIISCLALYCVDTVFSSGDCICCTAVATVFASSLFLMFGSVSEHRIMCATGLRECCTDTYIQPNMTRFKMALDRNLYGQHIAKRTVYHAVKAHVSNRNPRKPLVMSFHGWTGIGKNFMARMLVKSIYTKGEKSKFVHAFNSEVHFKHPHQVPLYKDQLQMWIKGNVSRCGRSIFIFDEIDHMPEGLIDALKPYLESQPMFDGVDYRKTIFVFLSNTGGSSIVEYCSKVRDEGKPRDSITLSEMQEILTKSAFNQKSGFKFSGVIDRNLINHFVPFLPLEKTHVGNCIKDEIKRIKKQHYFMSIEKYTEPLIQDILNELLWFPKESKLYSKSGCKKVAQKVALVLSDLDEL